MSRPALRKEHDPKRTQVSCVQGTSQSIEAHRTMFILLLLGPGRIDPEANPVEFQWLNGLLCVLLAVAFIVIFLGGSTESCSPLFSVSSQHWAAAMSACHKGSFHSSGSQLPACLNLHVRNVFSRDPAL